MRKARPTLPARDIPIASARHIAKAYGYDQIVIIGRRVSTEDDPGREHVTTYGTNEAHCLSAARIGDWLRYDVMKWPRPDEQAAATTPTSSATPPAPSVQTVEETAG